MSEFKVGDHVKITEYGKTMFRGECGKLGYHIDPDYPRFYNCMKCSSAHADEFEHCIGTIIEINEYEDIDVRWLPDNLRYSYRPEYLQKVALAAFS